MKKSLFIILLSAIILMSCGGSSGKNNNDGFALISDDTLAYVEPMAQLRQESSKTGVKDATEASKKTTETKKRQSIFAGYYYCSKTRDQYYFDDDHTGYFRPNHGGYKTDFTWKKYGTTVAVNYDNKGGTTQLTYNKERGILKEYSEIHGGTLVFKKQNID